MFEAVLQPKDVNHGPQDAVCKFLGSVGGTRRSKDDFYQRLADTADAALPAENLPVTLRTFEAGKGKHSSPPIPCNPYPSTPWNVNYACLESNLLEDLRLSWPVWSQCEKPWLPLRKPTSDSLIYPDMQKCAKIWSDSDAKCGIVPALYASSWHKWHIRTCLMWWSSSSL